MVGPAVDAQRSRAEEATDDEIVGLIGEKYPDAAEALPRPVVHQVRERSPAGAGMQLRPLVPQQDRGSQGSMGEMRRHQGPDSPAQQGKRHTHESIPDAVRDHIGMGQQPKAQLPLQEVFCDRGQTGDGEQDGQYPDHLGELRHPEELCQIRCQEPHHPGRKQAEERGRDKGSAEVGWLNARTLHQRRSQAELGKCQREYDDDEGRADDAKVGRREEAGKENQHQ